MDVVLGIVIGFVLWFFARYGLGGFYTIGPNERAVLCTFGHAQRLEDETTLSDPIAEVNVVAPEVPLVYALGGPMPPARAG